MICPLCLELLISYGTLTALDQRCHCTKSFHTMVSDQWADANDPIPPILVYLVNHGCLTSFNQRCHQRNSGFSWSANNRQKLVIYLPMSCTSDWIVTARQHLITCAINLMMAWSGKSWAILIFLLLMISLRRPEPHDPYMTPLHTFASCAYWYPLVKLCHWWCNLPALPSLIYPQVAGGFW